MKIRVAACQTSPSSRELDANLDGVVDAVRTAAAAGARLCVVPELSATGYELGSYRPHVAAQAPRMVERLTRLARDLDVTIMAGTLLDDGRHLRNAQLCITPDGLLGSYHKQLLMAHENLFAVPGDGPRIWDTPVGKIGCAICKDMLSRELFDAYRGRVDLVAISSAWPNMRRGVPRVAVGMAHYGNRLIEELPMRIARYVGAPVVYSDSWGGPHQFFGMEVFMLGGSRVATPDGRAQVATLTGEDLLVGEVEVGCWQPVSDRDPWPSLGPGRPLVALEGALTRLAGMVRRARRMLPESAARPQIEVTT